MKIIKIIVFMVQFIIYLSLSINQVIAGTNIENIYQEFINQIRHSQNLRIQNTFNRGALERQMSYNNHAFNDYKVALFEKQEEDISSFSSSCARRGVSVNGNIAENMNMRIKTEVEGMLQRARRSLIQENQEIKYILDSLE